VKVINLLKEVVHKSSAWVNGFGVSLLMLMMFATSLDVIFRYFRMPIEGAFEMVTFIQVIFVSFALPYTQSVKGNIAADLLVTKFSPKARAVTACVTTFLSFVLACAITWQSIVTGNALRYAGQHSVALDIPFFPFYWVVAFGAGLLSLVLFVELLVILSGRTIKE